MVRHDLQPGDVVPLDELPQGDVAVFPFRENDSSRFIVIGFEGFEVLVRFAEHQKTVVRHAPAKFLGMGYWSAPRITVWGELANSERYTREYVHDLQEHVRKCGKFFSRVMGRGKMLEWDCGQLADEAERLAGGAAGVAFKESE